MPQRVANPQNAHEVGLQRIIPSDGAPTAATGAGFAVTGVLCIDYANANLYVNAGDEVTPDWKLVTRAA